MEHYSARWASSTTNSLALGVKDLPAGRRTIGSKLVCHEKTDGEGTVYQ
jgi:hypothetical protein